MNACGQRYFTSMTIAYATDCRVIQEELHQILTQMSGFALLLFTRRRASAICAGPLEIVTDRLKAVSERMKALRPSPEARHHHHHIEETRGAIENAITIAFDCIKLGAADRDGNDLTRALRAAIGHLEATSRLLPGFEMVDLRHACCAVHLGPATAETVPFSG